MKVFTKCGVCGKEGQPEWNPGSGGQQLNYFIAPTWRNPPGWNDVLGVLMCEQCSDRVKNSVRDMAQPPRTEEASNASAPSGAPKSFSERGGGASLKGK